VGCEARKIPAGGDVFFLDFSLYRTLLMPKEPIRAPLGVNVPGLPMAGFQLTLHGRIWVTPEDFYVVFTNVSAEPQAVWEYWNSWGYQTVTFELTTEDGRKFLVSKRPQSFTMNFPSEFLIEPGEHQVFAIRLNDEWETHPALPKAAEMPIIL
jgi:hypothetical protein